MISQDGKKRPQSMPQTLPQSIQQSRILSLAQSMPMSQHTSGYNLTFNLAELGQPERKGNRSHLHNYDPTYGEETFKSQLGQNSGLIEKVMGSAEKSKVKKKLKLQRKSVPKKESKKATKGKQKSGSVEREKEVENLLEARLSMNQSMKDESVTKRVRKQSTESIKYILSNYLCIKEKPQSGKASKSTSPIKIDATKKPQRKVKSREQVSKSEIPAALEELIQKNAHDYIGTRLLL